MDTNVPTYIMPLFFTTKTQEIFQCKADKDLTEDSPYKIIEKEKILQDFKNRAAISDFHPARKIIENYPSDTLLIIYDPMFKYGQNFCLVTDDKQKKVLLEPEAKIDVVEAKSSEEIFLSSEEILRERSPKPWKSFGSEQEVEDEIINTSREKVKFILKRERRCFGGPTNFTDYDANKYVEYLPFECENFIKMNELDKVVQDLYTMKEVGCQTNRLLPRNACTQYEPRFYTEEQIHDVMKSKQFLEFFSEIVPRLEQALKENLTIDIFNNDFSVIGHEDSMFLSKSEINLKEYQSFTDLQFSKNKSISEVQWHPTIKGLIAVSCIEHMTFYDRVDNSTSLLMEPSLILIWSFGDPIHPLLLLESPTNVLCFKFNPTNPNIIAAGCINGQIVMWDITEHSDRLQNHMSHSKGVPVKEKSKQPVMFNTKTTESAPIVQCYVVSSIEKSHRTAVTDIQWIPDHIEIGANGIVYENTSGLCTQLLSCSSDGTVLFWDVSTSKSYSDTPKKKNQLESYSFQHLVSSWKPLLRVSVHKLKGNGEYSTVRCLISEQHQPKKKIMETPVQMILREPDPFEQSFKKKFEGNQMDSVDTKFLVATEDGEIVYQDWVPTKSLDTGKTISSPPIYCLDAHDGKISTLQWSPFIKNIILTVGGWTFALWKKDLTFGPIFQSFPHQCQLSSGHWSPTRPGVFFIGRIDGSIDIWDFLDKSHEPFLSQNVTSAPITAVFPFQISKKQQLLAVGDELGTLHILEVPWNLKNATVNEVGIIEAYFEREASRVILANERHTLTTNKAEEPLLNVVPIIEETSINDAEKLYLEYLELEKRILTELNMPITVT
ncbi:dynein axonemal intermediate chain 3 isoform X1 [Hydra vulgaris]|nr:dynein axonemal intermediate chain 3 [Hydra vulgaris]